MRLVTVVNGSVRCPNNFGNIRVCAEHFSAGAGDLLGLSDKA